MALKNTTANRPRDAKLEIKGLRTQDEDFEVGFDGMVLANNVDLTRKNSIERRPGRVDTSYVPAGTIHSAWADKQLFLFQEGTSLKRFRSATDVETLRTGLTIGDKISAYRIGNQVYWSNGFETGVVEPNGNLRDFGVPVPSRLEGAPTTGNLGEGRYSYVFTNVESDGRESGSPLPRTVDVGENEGFLFTFSAGLTKRFWITEANGDTLYLADEIFAGETGFSYRNGRPRTSIVLDRQLMSAPEAWHEIDWFRASLLFARNNNLEWTNEFDYELRDLAKGYMPFGERIHIIGGLRDGFYIGTETKHYWLTGSDMMNLSLTEAADYGAIPGTKVHINGSVVGTGEATERIPVWATQAGIVIGLPGGTLRNVHERVVDFSANSVDGTALYRRANKQNHYIAVVNGG
jgi:hypothetical protein